jgi:pSer/pThr/pTyr-binding forkhead associated (FHA) protein
MRGVVFTSGPLAGRQVEVTAVLVLGREAADLAVDDPEVSRRHASLRPAGDGLEIEDLGSLNGTWVNGARIEGVVRLSPGDRVRLGDTSFEVRQERAQPTVASQRPAPPVAERQAFSPPAQRGPRRRTVASRRLTPTLLSSAVVIATGVALILYFAMR